MGREATCRARLAPARSKRFGPPAEGKALLETDDVIFRGGIRARVPLREIEAVVVKAGLLSLTWPGGRLELSLGEAAGKWADAIRNPKSVLEKLGVEPGRTVAILGKFDAGFVEAVARRLGKPPVRRAPKRGDMVFLALAKPGDEARLAALRPVIAPAGAIWAVYPKGRRDLSEDTVRAAAKGSGLVDVKVVRFSETLGALKLVIPRASR